MAIGPKGEVTTTGLMNNSAKIPEASVWNFIDRPANCHGVK